MLYVQNVNSSFTCFCVCPLQNVKTFSFITYDIWALRRICSVFNVFGEWTILVNWSCRPFYLKMAAFKLAIKYDYILNITHTWNDIAPLAPFMFISQFDRRGLHRTFYLQIFNQEHWNIRLCGFCFLLKNLFFCVCIIW